MKNKIVAIILALVMILSLAACTAVQQPVSNTETTEPAEVDPNGTAAESISPEAKVLYNEEDYVMSLEYEGLDMVGLDYANVRFGSEKYSTEDIKPAGCSITFATYINGRTGAVRNMDLQMSQYCSYEFTVQPGDNVKYPFWGLSYLGSDEKSYKEMLDSGISKEAYATVPFLATDTMSFGRDRNGDRASLYCAVLMRATQYDENRQPIWYCSGTYPKAPIRCCTESVPALLAAQCLNIDDALKYTGAVDEKYRRLFPDTDPTLDIYTFNMEGNRWFEVVAMEDSTGRHGVLEFIDNYAIWHEGIDYSFNYFLQDEYLYNEDGTYKEQYGAGIGRYEATVPYLDQIYNVSDHLALMDSVRYSFLTYYSEPDGYIGRDMFGNPIDWRSEEAGADPWGAWYSYNELGIDTSGADAKYPLWANYIDTNTGEIVKIETFEEYAANYDHLKTAWTMNYVQADENYEEVMNYISWSGYIMNHSTPHEVALTGSGWETYFRVVCDPMAFKVTRWFNENVTTADTITWKTIVKE